jgi:hypothetical protein
MNVLKRCHEGVCFLMETDAIFVWKTIEGYKNIKGNDGIVSPHTVRLFLKISMVGDYF